MSIDATSKVIVWDKTEMDRCIEEIDALRSHSKQLEGAIVILQGQLAAYIEKVERYEKALKYAADVIHDEFCSTHHNAACERFRELWQGEK